ncbi:unnamed protein product [Pleuronectes platessa]|uniref:Uncharacterized protein n=1 Tax=Pleuronectes platessa TaxID=8262 RepID=A0A9N7Z8W2_PLEPL|nr:unnamed protein product [Pleuronectes platessa]
MLMTYILTSTGTRLQSDERNSRAVGVCDWKRLIHSLNLSFSLKSNLLRGCESREVVENLHSWTCRFDLLWSPQLPVSPQRGTFHRGHFAANWLLCVSLCLRWPRGGGEPRNEEEEEEEEEEEDST